jgi:hypothetical protein
MAAKENGMGPGKKPAKLAPAKQVPTYSLERKLTTVQKKGDTTITTYPKSGGMQLKKIMVTKSTKK